MPKRETDWARVEWDFLSLDERLHSMGVAQRYAFVCLWVFSVKQRCVEHANVPVLVKQLSRMCRLRVDTALNMIETCLRNGLLETLPSGGVSVPGVRLKHRRLQGWVDAPKCDSQMPGEEIRGEKKRGDANPRGTAPALPAKRAVAAPREHKPETQAWLRRIQQQIAIIRSGRDEPTRLGAPPTTEEGSPHDPSAGPLAQATGGDSQEGDGK